MPKHIALTERDEELLRALVLKVRLFSLRQIANHWWGGEIANTRRRLKQLVEAGLVTSAEVLARPISRLDGPIISWNVGDAAPDFGAIAYALQQRLRRVPARPTGILVASESAATLLGGRCRGELTHPAQASHDLGVAAIWLNFATHSPHKATAWIGEDLLSHTRHGQKCPDAFLVGPQGAVSSVVEFGGDYSRERIKSFHEDCADRELPYELW
jgi:hypothetical protein